MHRTHRYLAEAWRGGDRYDGGRHHVLFKMFLADRSKASVFVKACCVRIVFQQAVCVCDMEHDVYVMHVMYMTSVMDGLGAFVVGAAVRGCGV